MGNTPTAIDRETERPLSPPKGSQNNHSPEFVPRFAAGWVDLRKRNHTQASQGRR